VLVHGVTGSGKTHLARHLSAVTGLPWIESDAEAWLPGWRQRPLAHQRERIATICARDRWILDSAYSTWRDVVLSRTELVIGLDYPRWLSLARLLRRTAVRIVDRRPVCGDNTETLRQTLSRESIVAWHFRSFRVKRADLDAWEADPSAPPVLRFRSPRELERWLTGLTADPGRRVSDSTDPGSRTST
jgi:adenylate kinase family enzyme